MAGKEAVVLVIIAGLGSPRVPGSSHPRGPEPRRRLCAGGLRSRLLDEESVGPGGPHGAGPPAVCPGHGSTRRRGRCPKPRSLFSPSRRSFLGPEPPPHPWPGPCCGLTPNFCFVLFSTCRLETLRPGSSPARPLQWRPGLCRLWEPSRRRTCPRLVSASCRGCCDAPRSPCSWPRR